MNSKTLLASALCLAALAAGAHALRQDASSKKLYEMDQGEMMELQMKAMQLAQPGSEHELLEAQVGEWKDEIKLWMMPGMDPLTVEGSRESEMILGGRFLQTRSRSSFPMMGEAETLSMMGFDRRHEHYTTVGFDTLGTYYITAAGTFDEEGGTLVLRGTDSDPLVGEQVYEFRMEFPDEDTIKTSLVFFDLFQEGPFQMMEITSRRQE